MSSTPPHPPSFLWGHLFGTTKLPSTLLTGRTVVVTGSNQGLGLAAAHQLAALDPALLILAVRTAAKGEDAARAIKAKDSRETSKCVSIPDWTTTTDGWETTLQVNCLATGLLGLLVLPVLAKTASLPSPTANSTYVPHLTIVGSEVHNWAKFAEKDARGRSTLEVLNDKATSGKFIGDRYFTSKLINLYVARQLALLPAAKDLIVNSVNPGLCKSGLLRDFPSFAQIIMHAISWSTEKGARNISWAAADCTTSGSYIAFSKEVGTSKFSTSKEGLKMEQTLWKEMSDLWVTLAPEATKVLEA